MDNKKKIEEMKKILEVIGENYGLEGDYFYWKRIIYLRFKIANFILRQHPYDRMC